MATWVVRAATACTLGGTLALLFSVSYLGIAYHPFKIDVSLSAFAARDRPIATDNDAFRAAMHYVDHEAPFLARARFVIHGLQ